MPSSLPYRSFLSEPEAWQPSPGSRSADTYRRKASARCLRRWRSRTFPQDPSGSRHLNPTAALSMPFSDRRLLRLPLQQELHTAQNSYLLSTEHLQKHRFPGVLRWYPEMLWTGLQCSCRASLKPDGVLWLQPPPELPPGSLLPHSLRRYQRLSEKQRLPFSPEIRRLQALCHPDRHTSWEPYPDQRSGHLPARRWQQKRRLRRSRYTF